MAKRAATKRPAAKRPSAKTRAKKTPKRVTKKTARRKVAARAAATRKDRKPARPAGKKEPSTVRSAATAVKGAVAGAVAVVTKRLPGEPDAIALLETDHRRIEDLLKQGEDTTERAVKGRSDLLKTITVELNTHEL